MSPSHLHSVAVRPSCIHRSVCVRHIACPQAIHPAGQSDRSLPGGLCGGGYRARRVFGGEQLPPSVEFRHSYMGILSLVVYILCQSSADMLCACVFTCCEQDGNRLYQPAQRKNCVGIPRATIAEIMAVLETTSLVYPFRYRTETVGSKYLM